MYQICIIMILFISIYAQFAKYNLLGPQIRNDMFNTQRSSHQYISPQPHGGGFQSHAKYVKMQEIYHPPEAIGGGFQSRGGWSQTLDEPYVGPVSQIIINIATVAAGGHESNNKFA